MDMIITGLLGLAIKVVPDLFRVIAADRVEGDLREDVVKIVEDVVQTPDVALASKKLDDDTALRDRLKSELDALTVKALQEQARVAEELKEIDQAFLELRKAERDQKNKQQIEILEIDFQQKKQAQDYAIQNFKSDKWWVAGVLPILTLIIIFGFLITLYFILDPSFILPSGKGEIGNQALFYTALGVFATAFTTVIGFHFGSSSSSKLFDDVPLKIPLRAENQITPSETTASASEASGEGQERASGVAPSRATIVKVSPPDPGGRFGLFRQKTPKIANDLMRDLGLTLDQAAGILGNIGHECAGFRTLQEIKPIVPGSKGGWGWCQWTGIRRKDFEKWCQNNGFDNLSADDANYGFLKHELLTTEKSALQHLRNTVSLRDATESFMKKFERPGIDHLESRINWAKEALSAYRNAAI